jgi:2-keto-4-pentenoate hydratase/2-oxohepta-3-ene-1,7-dioic acid hydratase in catechol pathway
MKRRGKVMFFVSFINQGSQRVGVLNEGKSVVLDLGLSDMIEGIALGERWIASVREQAANAKAGEWVSLDEVRLLAPIPRPRKNIFCVGKNYAEHAMELGGAESIPQHPVVFSKFPTTVIAHEDDILRHADVTEMLDYEGELAVVIGRKGRKIAKEEALDYVFGYTIINDVTARDLQKRHLQFDLGKSLDTFCPMGPYLVYKEAIPNPGALKIETRVNGEVRQSSNTQHFIFDIPTLIATISAGITLEPGDIIATGTPAGVGLGFKPPRLLSSGDQVEIEVEGIGILRNRVK